MSKVLLNFLNLTAIGSETTVQVQVLESHKAEFKTTTSSCIHIWSACSRYFHSWTIILLSHLQIVLQIQQGVWLYISKWHNHPFTCFKVRIICTVKQSDINKFTKINSTFKKKKISGLSYIVKNSKISLYLQKIYTSIDSIKKIICIFTIKKIY